MTVKAQVEIDLADGAFKDFIKLWDKFRGEADKLPDNLGQIGEKLKSESVSFGDMVAAMVAQAVILKKMDGDSNKRVQNVTKEETSWKKMSTYTKDFASNIAASTKSLLRWTSITSVISGLVGAGSLFGLDRLAENVSLGRRQAAGLGSTYGEQSAFNLDQSRFVNPGTFLSGVNQALTDVNQRVALLSMGVPQRVLNTNDATQVGSDLLIRLKDLADRTNPMMYQQAIEARGLGGIVSATDLKALHGFSRQEVLDQQKRFQSDAVTLGLDPKTQLAWQNFDTQLSRAGKQIETSFINGLTPLTPALSQLSDAVSQGITTIMGSISKQDITDLSAGIHNFAVYIASGEFKQNLMTFVTDVGIAAHKIADALTWLGLIPKSKDAPLTSRETGVWNATHPASQQKSYPKGSIFDTNPNRQTQWYDPGSWLSGVGSAARADQVANIEWDKGLPKGLLWQVYGAESGFGKNEGLSKAGALGAFQMMSRTAASYGVHDRTNFDQESVGAGNLLADLLRRYKGNVAEALAGYNWGEGNVDKDLKKYGSDWQKHIPKETQNYINKITSALDTKALATAIKKASGPVTSTSLKIENNTGGSAIVTANQAAN